MLNKNGCLLLFGYFVLLTVLVIFGCSCNSTKQAQKHYDKAKEKSIIVVADNARKDFPCTTTKADTTWGKDSIISIERTITQEVSVYITDTIEGKPITIVKTVKADCKCKDSIIYQSQFITKTVEDSAKILIAENKASDIQKIATKALSGQKTCIIVASVLFILLACALVFLIIRK